MYKSLEAFYSYMEMILGAGESTNTVSRAKLKRNMERIDGKHKNVFDSDIDDDKQSQNVVLW